MDKMDKHPNLPLGMIATVEDLLVAYACPVRIWATPTLWTRHGEALVNAFADQPDAIQSTTRAWTDQAACQEPAILALAAVDMNTPERSKLLELAQQVRPGRPVVYGGARNKETLLDAINIWQAFRLVPESLPVEALIETLREAHHALMLQYALECCVAELQEECDHLRSAVAELNLTQARVLHGERLAVIGQMTGMLMNYVQQHYHSMQRFADALRPFAGRPHIARLLQQAIEGTHSVDVLLRDLIALTENRHEDVSLGDEALDQVVERAVTLFRLDPLAREREVRLHCSSGATVRIDRYRTYHVLMNLLRNAVQATHPDAPIEVRTASESQTAVIEVQDHGPGISPEQLKSIFTPFFTTKGNQGTGLGLRMSKASVERQGGGLECVSTPGDGTCFRIRFPLTRGNSMPNGELNDPT